MITIKFQEGSGIGNQLWNYAVMRSIAKKNNYDWGIIHPYKFKGQHFLDIDYGKPVGQNDILFGYEENIIRHPKYGKDISPMDKFMYEIPDSTCISGTMQSIHYFDEVSKEEIYDWVKVKDPYRNISDNVTLVHFRGGDFKYAGNTLLTKKYYLDAINHIKSINKDMIFAIVTDDPALAKEILGNEILIIGSSNHYENDPYQASHHIGKRIDIDFKLMCSAKNLIISNSSYSWWATYLNKNNPLIIAPKFWAAHNYDEPFWSTNDMQVPGWKYLDKYGNID